MGRWNKGGARTSSFVVLCSASRSMFLVTLQWPRAWCSTCWLQERCPSCSWVGRGPTLAWGNVETSRRGRKVLKMGRKKRVRHWPWNSRPLPFYLAQEATQGWRTSRGEPEKLRGTGTLWVGRAGAWGPVGPDAPNSWNFQRA